MQAALGLTSCEGAFRAACEAVLGTARHSQADLLQLLRANLQDPALNWRLREQETHRKASLPAQSCWTASTRRMLQIPSVVRPA